MKHFYFLVLSIFLCGFVFAQQGERHGEFTVYGPFEANLVHPTFNAPIPVPTPGLIQEEMNDRLMRKEPSYIPDPYIFHPDPVLQQNYNYSRIPVTTIVHNIDGLGNTGVQPPDPTGSVGTNHYVQAINSSSGCSFRVFDKNTGAVVTTMSFTGLGGSNYTSYGDPVVVFDELANRWVFAEIFGNFFQSRINVYVSQSDDPTNSSAWYHYQITVSGSDYPKISMWPSCYLLTCNDGGPSVYALNRTAMLSGNPTTVIQRTASDLSGFGFQALTPVDFDGPNTPPVNAPGILMRHRDTEAHGPGGQGSNDIIEIFEFTPNFTIPASSVWTGPIQISVSEFNSNLNGLTAFNCFPQPNGQKLDPLRELLMNRAQYINFGTYQSIVCAQVTDVNNADLGGVRWYEFRNTGSGWTLYQEGTYSPDNINRWMPGISQDLNGNIAVAYSMTNSTTFPALGLTGRSSFDALGQMTLSEYTIVSGSSSQTGERWGDYFCMSLDPVDYKTFWFTGEYMKTGGNWGTRVFAFRFSQDTLDANLFALRDFSQPICDTTGKEVLAIIRNTGIDTLSSLNVSWELNGGGLTTINWTGNLESGNSDTLIINLSGLNNGNNTLLVYCDSPNGNTDDNPFNDTISLTFPVSIGLNGSSVLAQDITCNNASNGQISFTASGGFGPYTYSIGGNYSGSNPITGISGGTYTCSIKDAAGCIYTTSPTITLTNPPAISLSATKTDCSSGTANDGTITVTASGGTGTLEYSIDGTNYQSSNVFTGLAPGNYTVYVRDANGCVRTTSLNIGALGVDVNPLTHHISILPNPNNGIFKVNYQSGVTLEDVKFEIVDLSGRKIQVNRLKNSVSEFSADFDLQNESKGMYILRISANQWTHEERIIVD